MKLPFRTRRSAGVPVTPATHRIIAAANAARDRGDWPAAAAQYRQALAQDPTLAHIHVQLGNMAHEQNNDAEARAAHEAALRLRPGYADAHLQLGHLADARGDHAATGAHYLAAYTADPRLGDAARGLHRAMARTRGDARTRLLDALRTPGSLPGVPPSVPDAATAAIVFDISDLVGYWSGSRLPTGIQRVQIQLVTYALHQAPPPGLCCFIEGRDAWIGLDPALFQVAAALSLASGDADDPAWIAALHRLHLHLMLAAPCAFPHGAALVNLGSSWQVPNYFLFIRDAKRRFGIRYVPFIHDLIPILAPQYFTVSARRDVVPWVAGVFAHADHILVNSEATKRDVLQVGATMGRALAPEDVAVIRLDADCRNPDPAPNAPDPSPAEPFVLFVATIEVRKGHVTALDAWSALIAQHGPAVPRLVCVGKRGWLSGPVYRRLEDPALAARVTLRHAVSDAELARLYRTCLFTLYPSHYEGWGLPITESLCHGKPVIAADTSSLPEAGGDLALYVQPGDAPALAEAAARLIFNAPYREALAARIRAGFHPRTWSGLATQMQAELARMAARGTPPVLPSPMARLGAYHSLAQSRALRAHAGAASGEAFRDGTGWAPPDAAGSRIRPGGAVLAVSLPPRAAPLRAGLLLLGASTPLDWRIDVRGGPALSGTLAAVARTWATFTYPMDAPGELRLRLDAGVPEPTGDDSPEQVPPDGNDLVALAGFFIYPEGEAARAMPLLEAIALGNLDDVDAFHDPADQHAGDARTVWPWPAGHRTE